MDCYQLTLYSGKFGLSTMTTLVAPSSISMTSTEYTKATLVSIAKKYKDSHACLACTPWWKLAGMCPLTVGTCCCCCCGCFGQFAPCINVTRYFTYPYATYDADLMQIKPETMMFVNDEVLRKEMEPSDSRFYNITQHLLATYYAFMFLPTCCGCCCGCCGLLTPMDIFLTNEYVRDKQ